uniref:Uncharacterized protein n=1 Tax=Clytia hemisphaerica TaxID=252671 RepID=A0A7M5XDY1_9CNID
PSEASYDTLAERMITAIKENLSADLLTRLCGIAADGPYQASNFKSELRDLLGIKGNDELQLPITWDPGHQLNLAVTDICDSKSLTGEFLSTSIKRCNLFNQTLARGKGFAFLNIVDEKSLTPVTY